SLQQDMTLNGVVTSRDGQPLAGVNVELKGTNRATMTDNRGKYSLAVPDKANTPIFVFSHLGYQVREEIVTGRRVIDVVLYAEEHSLDEVVVVGYGTQKRRETVGSISKVSGDNITKLPTT